MLFTMSNDIPISLHDDWIKVEKEKSGNYESFRGERFSNIILNLAFLCGNFYGTPHKLRCISILLS